MLMLGDRDLADGIATWHLQIVMTQIVCHGLVVLAQKPYSNY